MPDETASNSEPRGGKMGDAIRTLPGWKIKLFAVSLVLTFLGLGAQLSSGLLNKRITTEASTTEAPSKDPSVPSQQLAPNATGSRNGSPAETAEPSQSLTQRVSPWVTKVGLSFFVGLCAGLIFRTFIKTMAIVTALAVAIGAALSYFNVDTSAAKAGYDSGAGWMTSQAERLKDTLMTMLPSATSGAVGFFAGFKKR